MSKMARYLTRDNLEQIANGYASMYYTRQGYCDSVLLPICPETLATDVLGLRIQYLPLCRDGSILGLSTFDDVEIQIAMDDWTVQVEQLTSRDIAIDQALEDSPNIGRRNFTIMHEVAHHILCRMFPREYGPLCHRKSHVLYRKSGKAHDWIEWQADTLAASLLMPEKLIRHSMESFCIGEKLEMLNRVFRPTSYEAFCSMAEFMGVSKQALEIRMKQLNLIGRSYLRNPYALVDVIMEDMDEFSDTAPRTQTQAYKC